jgi:hypothetical protein
VVRRYEGMSEIKGMSGIKRGRDKVVISKEGRIKKGGVEWSM